jgi:thiaminase/transcriptional activator TenA
MHHQKKIQLTARLLEEQKVSTECPPVDSLFWRLWESAKPFAEKALETEFLKGLKYGNLDPMKFTSFNVSNAYYCYGQSDCFEIAEQRAQNPRLKTFLREKIKGYKIYNERFQKHWFIKDASGIAPPPICKEYSDYELEISSQEDPIYTLILMLPCEYFWPWFSKEILPEKSGNPYEGWIRENLIPEISYEVGNFIDLYLKHHPNAIDEEKAIKIYKQSMEYEYAYFLSATE